MNRDMDISLSWIISTTPFYNEEIYIDVECPSIPLQFEQTGPVTVTHCSACLSMVVGVLCTMQTDR